MPSITRGDCRKCHRSFAKSQMTRHLKSCLGSSNQGDSMLILVELPRSPFWVYLTVPNTVKLMSIDAVLRDLWLDCCGHMSEFSSHDDLYVGEPDEPLFGRKRERSMNVSLKRAIGHGSLVYQYDFGSTTTLVLRVMGEKVIGLEPGIKVVARNDAPDIRCTECGGVATELLFDDWAPIAYCDECLGSVEEDGEAYTLPVVNSPRMGVCAYSGPSIEP